MLTTRDVETLISDPNRTVVEITRCLCELEGEPITVNLANWKFHDWRPRDEWFQVESAIQGRVHRLKLYLAPHKRIDRESKQRLWQIGPKSVRPPLSIQGVVSGSSALSSGLFVDIMNANIGNDM